MQTYVASIGGTAIMIFRAEDEDQAHAIIEERNMRSDLHTLVGPDGKPLWDGKSEILSPGGDASAAGRMGTVSRPSDQRRRD